MAVKVGELYALLKMDDRQFQKGLRDAKRGMDSAENSARDLAATLTRRLGGAIAAVGLTKLAKDAFDAGIALRSFGQQASIGFETMLGGADKARQFMSDLQRFAAETPFEFQGLVRSAQQMLAFGTSSDQVLPRLRAVGDAVAALGGGSEGIDRVTRALGQMQAKGVVSSEEMLQLTEAGIEAWAILAEKIGVTVPEAMDLVAERAISAQEGIDAIVSGIEERFGGMMERQAKTFEGLRSTIIDELRMATSEGVQPLFDTLQKEMEELKKDLPLLADAVRIAFEGISSILSGVVDNISEIAREVSTTISLFESPEQRRERILGMTSIPALEREREALEAQIEVMRERLTRIDPVLGIRLADRLGGTDTPRIRQLEELLALITKRIEELGEGAEESGEGVGKSLGSGIVAGATETIETEIKKVLDAADYALRVELARIGPRFGIPTSNIRFEGLGLGPIISPELAKQLFELRLQMEEFRPDFLIDPDDTERFAELSRELENATFRRDLLQAQNAVTSQLIDQLIELRGEYEGNEEAIKQINERILELAESWVSVGVEINEVSNDINNLKEDIGELERVMQPLGAEPGAFSVRPEVTGRRPVPEGLLPRPGMGAPSEEGMKFPPEVFDAADALAAAFKSVAEALEEAAPGLESFLDNLRLERVEGGGLFGTGMGFAAGSLEMAAIQAGIQLITEIFVDAASSIEDKFQELKREIDSIDLGTDRLSIAETFAAFENRERTRQQLTDQARRIAELRESIEDTRGFSGFLRFGFAQDEIREELEAELAEAEAKFNELREQLEGVRTELIDALGIAADNFAAGIQSALDSASFEEFSANLEQSVDAIIRRGLIAQLTATTLEPLIQMIAAEVQGSMGLLDRETLEEMLPGLTAEQIDTILNEQLDMEFIEMLREEIEAHGGTLIDLFEELGIAVEETTRQFERLVNVPLGFRALQALRFQASTPQMVPALANGGIVTRPTLALIGEAGPEAVLPLRGGGGGGFGDMYVTGPITVVANDVQTLERQLRELQRSESLRRTGNPTALQRVGR